jgi:regulator of nonsense transcripts 1
LTRDIIQEFLDTTHADGCAIGLAPAYGKQGVLSAIALASSQRVLLIYLSRRTPVVRKAKYRNVRTGRELLYDLVLWAESYTKYAFRMDLVAASLCLDHELRIGRAVDLLSAALEFRDSVAARMSVLGGEAGLNKGHLINLFRHDENSSSPVSHLALQAWAAWRAGTLPSMAQRLAKVPRIDTRAFCETVGSLPTT